MIVAARVHPLGGGRVVLDRRPLEELTRDAQLRRPPVAGRLRVGRFMNVHAVVHRGGGTPAKTFVETAYGELAKK